MNAYKRGIVSGNNENRSSRRVSKTFSEEDGLSVSTQCVFASATFFDLYK